MAIVFKKVVDGKKNLEIDSNIIIGIMGQNFEKFVRLLSGKDIFLIKKENRFTKKTVHDEMLSYYNVEYSKYNFDDLVKIVFDELKIEDDFSSKNIDELSDSERIILKYILSFISNKKIIVIDEPFLDLDYTWKKRISSLLNSIIHNTKKTIIICSNDSNIIYSLCQKVLFINDEKCFYDNTLDAFKDNSLLKKYHIDEPDIIKFINLAHKKNVDLRYSKDIRDLIKDVYKSV